jgi:Tat protein translocase TatB subunit
MLDVGFSEILLTSAIALVVLGPERLPKVARQVGNWMGRARAMARQLSEQLEREVNADELLKAQSKSASSGHLPGGRPTALPVGGTLESSYAQAAAPQSVTSQAAVAPAAVPPQAAASPSVAVPAPDMQPPVMAPHPAAMPSADAIPPAPSEPEPTFGGLPPSATTPAAMHASDPLVADSKSPHE